MTMAAKRREAARVAGMASVARGLTEEDYAKAGVGRDKLERDTFVEGIYDALNFVDGDAKADAMAPEYAAIYLKGAMMVEK